MPAGGETTDDTTCYVCMNLLVGPDPSRRQFSRYRTELRCPTPNCRGWVCQACYRTARSYRALRAVSRCGLCRAGPMIKTVRQSAGQQLPHRTRRSRSPARIETPSPARSVGVGGGASAAWCVGLGRLCARGAVASRWVLRAVCSFGNGLWRRSRVRRAHIALAFAHTWFVSTWSGSLASWFVLPYQVPGCGPEFAGQGTYLPLRGGVYEWRSAALDVERARVFGAPTSGLSGAMVSVCVPVMHAGIDACLAWGDAPAFDIWARWVCSGAVYAVLMFHAMRAMLWSVLIGPQGAGAIDPEGGASMAVTCSADHLTTALVFAHGVSIMLFTVWAALTVDVARSARERGRRGSRISL